MTKASKRVARITPGWYQVGTTQTIGALGSVTFDFRALSNLLSDATTLGKTPMVACQSIVINHSGTYDVALAEAQVADIQRLCFYRMNQEIPNLTSKYFLVDPSLAFVRQASLVVNPMSVIFDQLLDAKKREFQDFDSIDGDNPLLGNAVIPNPSITKRPVLTSSWRDDENPQIVQSLGAVNFDFNDIVTMPFCAYSGNVFNDRVPLSMLTDPGNSWKLTITEQTAGGANLRTGLFDTTAHTVTVELWVYVMFLDPDSSISIGNLWTVAPQSFVSNQTLTPHRYKFFGMVPDYASTNVDTVPCPYEPFDYFKEVIDNNVRIFDCTQQVFPLPQFSNAIHTIDH